MAVKPLRWSGFSPWQALAMAERGERALLLPTRENLKLLAQSTNTEAALNAARGRKIVPFTPRGP